MVDEGDLEKLDRVGGSSKMPIKIKEFALLVVLVREPGHGPTATYWPGTSTRSDARPPRLPGHIPRSTKDRLGLMPITAIDLFDHGRARGQALAAGVAEMYNTVTGRGLGIAMSSARVRLISSPPTRWTCGGTSGRARRVR